MRIQLTLPPQQLFHYPIQVRTHDINFAGHMGNECILIYAQECRSRWLFEMGYSESNVEGAHTLVADAAIQYIREGYAQDQLTINLLLGDQHRFGFDLYYQILRQTITGDTEEIARAKTAILFRDNRSLQLCAPPTALLASTFSKHSQIE